MSTIGLKKIPVIPKKPPTLDKLLEDTRVKQSLANLSRGGKLTAKQFQEVRDLLDQGLNYTEIGAKYNSERDLISHIDHGLMHRDEFAKMTPDEQHKYILNYTLPQIEKNKHLQTLKKQANTADDLQKEYNKQNSIVSRKVNNIDIFIEIMRHKFKMKLDSTARNEIYINQKYILDQLSPLSNGDQVTLDVIKNIWSGKTKVFSEEFSKLKDPKLTYEQYIGLRDAERGKKPDLDYINDLYKNLNFDQSEVDFLYEMTKGKRIVKPRKSKKKQSD